MPKTLVSNLYEHENIVVQKREKVLHLKIPPVFLNIRMKEETFSENKKKIDLVKKRRSLKAHGLLITTIFVVCKSS